MAGVADKEKSLVGFDGEFDSNDISKRIYGFTNTTIDVKYRSLKICDKSIGLIYIPRRLIKNDPAQFLKAAPESENGRKAFSKNDLYMRSREECRPAQSAEDFSILFQRRRDHEIGGPNAIYVEHNLPAKDPSLIDFVGRDGQLDGLWRWFSERHTAVKLLSGPGGVGKTSIAWTFCDTVIASPPVGIEKVIWLTAKRKTFTAMLGGWVEIGTTHFDSLPTLLKALLGELGVPDDQIPDPSDRDVLIDEVIDALKTWPCLLVVDDIDSLPQEAQFDVFRTVSMIFDRAIASGSQKARALLTARLNLGAAPGQLMVVEGMLLPEFEEYVKTTASELRVTLPIGTALNNSIRKLHDASSGSPLFAASILRLVSLGEDLSSAIKNYKGADGEEVRQFAFERELDGLGDSAIRTLFAAINLKVTSQPELMEITNSTLHRLREDLSVLRDYHLVSIGGVEGDLGRGLSSISVPTVILSMVGIIRKKVHDPKRIEDQCAKARRAGGDESSEHTKYIRQISAYWDSEEWELALDTAKVCVKKYPKAADLWCMVGKAHIRLEKPEYSLADAAFRKATELGCDRPELSSLRIVVKEELGDWNGLILFIESEEREKPSPKSVLSISRARIALGDDMFRIGDWASAANQYLTGASEVAAAFDDRRATGYVEPLKDAKYQLGVAYVNATIRGITTDNDKIDVLDAVAKTVAIHVFHRGQIFLAIRSLVEWWSAVEKRDKLDEKTAAKMFGALNRVGRISDKCTWPDLAEEISTTMRSLTRRLEIYNQRRLR